MTSRQMTGFRTLSEMKEFATLSAPAQRYIRRALDIGLDRAPAAAFPAPSSAATRAVAVHKRAYRALANIRCALPAAPGEESPAFIGALVEVSGFDLAQGQLDGFAPFRFLYERLLGAPIRPWLPLAFCAAASLPQLPSSQRARLLRSISEGAATASVWSEREPMFFPDWISGDDLAAV